MRCESQGRSLRDQPWAAPSEYRYNRWQNRFSVMYPKGVLSYSPGLLATRLRRLPERRDQLFGQLFNTGESQFGVGDFGESANNS